jgi:16S rRNA (uracil1498-N3)-methyltransferase
MSMDYFYTDASNIVGSALTILGDEAKHLSRVLRKVPGEVVWVTDGADNAYQVVIQSISKQDVICEILERCPRLHESALDLTLAVGMIKNPSRMDWLIEKATELGVRRFIPMRTARSIHHSAKIERWSSLALAAMKQSMRCWLPPVDEVAAYSSVLAQTGMFDLAVILHEAASPANHLQQIVAQHTAARSALLLIGPEGGFTDEEIAAAEHAGCLVASLGVRRLRTETAAVVAAAWVIGRE